MEYQTTRATPQTPKIGHGDFDTLVLADDGADMWLVRAAFDTQPEPGTAFRFQGIEWQIAWLCDYGCGATPITEEQVQGNA